VNPTTPLSWRRRLGALLLGSAVLTGLVPVRSAGAVDAGVIVTLAGSTVDSAPTRLNHPRTAAVDTRGDVYFTDTDNNRIRRIDSSGHVTNIAGNGIAGYGGDGGPATQASIWRPHGVAVDNRSHVFIADSPNHRIRRVDLATGIIITVAGTGQSGYSGDNGPATAARLDRPRFLIVAPDGSLIIADTGGRRVRKVSPSGIITTIAGTGETGYTGDGGQATFAALDDPRGLALDAAGNLYVSNAEGTPIPGVRRISPSGVITTVAGGNPAGFSGDGGPATAARLNEPRSIAVRGSNLYIADSINNRIRRVDLATGIITTVAGTGRSGFGGDGGPAIAARLAEPRGLTLTPSGDIVILDTNNNRVRLMGAPSGSGGPAPGPLPPTAELHGRVLDRADRAAAAASVEILDSNGEPVTGVRPDVSGAFSVGLDDGVYSVAARSAIGCSPLQSQAVPVSVLDGVADPSSATLRLETADEHPVAFDPVTVKVERSADNRATTVVETPAGDVRLSFEGLTQNGSVTAGCRAGGWEAGQHDLLDTGVSLTASGLQFSAVTVCLPYTPAQAAARFGNLDVDENLDVVQVPAGVALPTARDPQAQVVCGRSNSLTDVTVGFLNHTGVTSSSPAPARVGYRLVATDGGIFAFGDAAFLGSTGAVKLNQPIVATAATPTGKGYWLAARDGGIFAFGEAGFYGSTGGVKLNQPIVGMAASPTGRGYWLVATDGGIFTFGDAAFYGSTGAVKLNKPIVGMAASPTGRGYWLVASDGGIFAFGDAAFFGSTGAVKLNKPIVGMAATSTGRGYWLVASDGGMFSFGDAAFYGSTGGTPLNRPIVGMAPTRTARGYWLVASDGGIFAFGDARFLGSAGALPLAQPVVAITAL
jgi:sugar lactone lactonase YvrE